MCWPKETGGLGFRDLQSFNLAMLAKQGWRLIQNEDSLILRILRAKYYSNGDFWSANLGSNPSYTWISILEGRNVLNLGLFWRVGNGSTIKINDNP